MIDTTEKENLTLGMQIKSRLSFIITLFFALTLITILILVIFLSVHFNNVTINENKSFKKADRIPIIGITGMRIPDGTGETMFTADQTQIHYIEAIEKSGGIPISLPVLQSFNTEIIKRQVEVIDSLLIQGGLDVTPSLYHEERKPETDPIDLQTDMFIIEAIKQAAARKIPILGICRGIQILNVAYGGNLYQDLKYAGIVDDSHKQPYNDTEGYKHTINVSKNSILSKMFPNNNTLYVNSFHHQAIKDLAPHFIIDAKSDDGIIEAMHLDSTDQWIFAVQFHPEQNMRYNNDFKPIFTEFINQAKKSQLN